ncbi:MAG: sugar ABC transporter permease [Pelagibacteraceae bacterium]|jgi:multiple sugar transport system permease protein|nr:sugar ABC transporter permease [Pelagibacteraceae bacterium]MBT3902170.1 sugar ABC transporter permease [Pelagibacteraceae bacterium]MBT4646196.1 sugar ABC transporter permease [Pelagibacteraceae bacterium]MBT4950158.1 sugar ABC transporter permease [Pelagibacteraceae bacterium]MBT5214572.1 sugar ABC transporter permease [Pelagibacteraceae bacterium]
MKKFLNGPWVLLLPTVIVLACVVFLPLLISLWTSFTPFKLTRPDTLYKFVGFRNYERLFGNYDFWVAFGRTVLFLTIALNLELVFGLGIALLINKITYAQKTLRTLMMFPMMFSPILVGFQWKYIFNDNIGLLNNFLREFGISPKPWLVDTFLANMSIMAAEIWSSTSVFAILLLAGLMGIPKDPIEAAKVDGCNSWQVFKNITLPFLMPFIFIAMTIRSLDVARAYDIVQMMTGGGPAKRTELLWTLISRTGYVDAKMGLANAMSYISIFLSIAFTFFFFYKLMEARKILSYD